MNSNKPTKFLSERPGSSARVHDYGNANNLVSGSKIPKYPKRTYSLEGKGISCTRKRSKTKNKITVNSMIPRPGFRKQVQKTEVTNNVAVVAEPNESQKKDLNLGNEIKLVNEGPIKENPERFHESLKPVEMNKKQPTEKKVKEALSEGFVAPVELQSEISLNYLENKIKKDFRNFKESILKIPEYWTDSGENITTILKNAITIITKQYPTADVETFEQDIQKVLKATETVKQQILFRIENIINKASIIYDGRKETDITTDEQELRRITKKMENLKNEVNYRKNIFGDLLRYGNEMKELIELEQSLKQTAIQKETQGKMSADITGNDKVHGKYVERKKSKLEMETVSGYNKKIALQSCGDAQSSPHTLYPPDSKLNPQPMLSVQEQSTQTLYSFYEDLLTKEKLLKDLTKEILELHQLCKSHISKYKNFNLQIKMKGMSNKVYQSPTKTPCANKALKISHDERGEMADRFNFTSLNNKITDPATKQKEMSAHHKEKLVEQQKKLLQVRDELISMLKAKYSLEEGQRC